jgi:hypothetical protein
MADPHAQAVRAALRTNKELKELFQRMGDREHPRGRILAIYRTYHAALRDAWGRSGQVIETLAGLRRELVNEAGKLVQNATLLGEHQAEEELEIYGVVAIDTTESRSVAATGWQATWDAQLNQAQALMLSGMGDQATVLGDADRAGLLSPGPVLREGARWLAIAALARYATVTQASLARAGRAEEFQRQAVAAIDERTTQCCLRVHGQVVGMDEAFKLTGTPRYADEMRHPPFHPYCRTSVALVPAEEAGDRLTNQMRDAARDELAAREDGSRAEIHPADARSRRN